MSVVYHFLKSTTIGGLVFLVPVVVLGALIGWAATLAYTSILPLFEWLPDKSVGGVSLVALGAIAGLVGACFVAGLFAQTAVFCWLGAHAERFALFVPGYALMKHVGADLVGIERKHPVKTVAVRFEASWQLGFLIEQFPDGRNVVFVPGVPRALVGTLHLVATDRVEVLSMSVATAMDILSRLGVGWSETWPAGPRHDVRH